MSDNGVGTRGAMRLAGALIAVLLVAAIASASRAAAQTGDPPAGSTLRVANTDGTDLNLRAAPSTSGDIVATLPAGSLLTVTGPARPVGDARWLPVRDTGGHNGWVDAQYAAVVSTPTPVATATPRPSPAEAPAADVEPTPAPTAIILPVEVEARVKFPETSGRDQEINIWVTRNGAPVPGAMVTVVTDEGDTPFDRPIELTGDDGHAHHAWDIHRDKGTISLIVKATAPDGGEGTVETSYFRR